MYHFIINGEKLTTVFWITMGVLTVILFVADMIVNSLFVKRFGGSKWGEHGAGIAVLVGSFVIPPFGILILPPIIVLIIETLQKRSLREAIRAATGSFIGFLSGTFAKIMIQLVMIIWFVIVALF